MNSNLDNILLFNILKVFCKQHYLFDEIIIGFFLAWEKGHNSYQPLGIGDTQIHQPR